MSIMPSFIGLANENQSTTTWGYLFGGLIGLTLGIGAGYQSELIWKIATPLGLLGGALANQFLRGAWSDTQILLVATAFSIPSVITSSLLQRNKGK